MGRGALSGPLVACACVLPNNKRLYGLRDSKLLSSKERIRLADKIKRQARDFAYGIVESNEIEEYGLNKAGFLAFLRALKNLKIKPDFVLVDGYNLPNCPYPHKKIKKGDVKCASIAAASILAKVYRDKLMEKLAKEYPGYHFEKNKGYGTKEHLCALKTLGPSKIHRKNFEPVKNFLMAKR